MFEGMSFWPTAILAMGIAVGIVILVSGAIWIWDEICIRISRREVRRRKAAENGD